MNKVIIIRPIIGLTAMQVCAEKDVTDEEILFVCNEENPAGTSGGWQSVVRDTNKEYIKENMLPALCLEHEDRIHYIIIC